MQEFDPNEELPRVPGRGPGDTLEHERSTAIPMVILRYLDIPLVVLAAIPALALGAPPLGYAVGAVAWIIQRALAQADRRWIANATAPRTQLGLNLFEAFGRIWLLAGAIVLAGVVGGRADGLTAALVIFGAYSVAFAIKVLSGPPARPASSARPAPPTRLASSARSASPASAAASQGHGRASR
jgi:hypothetical protein